jgi:hypothetical protein
VTGSNTAKHAASAALLDPSAHCQAQLTHTSHHGPTLVDLSRFRVSSILTDSRFMRFCRFISGILGVSIIGVSPISADVAVVVVRPDFSA